MSRESTPRQDGFSMPPEWGEHSATLIAWPTRVRASIWDGAFDRALNDYATIVGAIAEFEPVLLVVHPEQTAEARRYCTSAIEVLPMEIDDSWLRDNGPIFVQTTKGENAIVDFGFNGWGNKYNPWNLDTTVPERLAAYFGVQRYKAPMVLEGGSFFVDGEGTLFTTEQCLLHPNRNPHLDQSEIEKILSDYVGIDVVVWLDRGHHMDRDTDGHIDGIFQVLAPGKVILHLPDEGDPSHAAMQENRRRLEAAANVVGRKLSIIAFDPGESVIAPLNFYLCNGAAIVPTAGDESDDAVLRQLRNALPDRELVPVPGSTLLVGGGGPHCITQQVPIGV